MEHKHAAILMRAIADGVPLSEFELRSIVGGWVDLADADGTARVDWFYEPEHWEVRRKPKTININGHEVPNPLAYLENGAEYFTFCIIDGCAQADHHFNRDTDIGENHCRMGIAHATKEAAEAHAKALLSFTAKDLT
jgi:hypothetical protein